MNLNNKHAMSTVKERLKEYLAYKNLSQSKFADVCGLSRGFVNNIVNSIQPKTLDRITMHFDDLNASWLLTGDGEMINSHESKHNTIGIRYHNYIDATAGNAMMFDDEREDDYKVMSIPGFEDCTDAVNVWGDSMYPVLNSGEVILLKEWKESFINFGKIYLIVTKNGNRMVKYLKPSEKEGMVKCVSENPEHPPFDIPFDSIHKLYIVKGHIEKCEI